MQTQQRHFRAASLIKIKFEGSSPKGASNIKNNVCTMLLNLSGYVLDIRERFYAMYIDSNFKSALASECRIVQIYSKIGV